MKRFENSKPKFENYIPMAKWYVPTQRPPKNMRVCWTCRATSWNDLETKHNIAINIHVFVYKCDMLTRRHFKIAKETTLHMINSCLWTWKNDRLWEGGQVSHRTRGGGSTAADRTKHRSIPFDFLFLRICLECRQLIPTARKQIKPHPLWVGTCGNLWELMGSSFFQRGLGDDQPRVATWHPNCAFHSVKRHIYAEIGPSLSVGTDWGRYRKEDSRNPGRVG